MSRQLMAIVISSALVFGDVSTSAWSANAPSNAAPGAQPTEAVQTAAAVNNQSPLPAGGAAGIKQAQAEAPFPPWAAIAFVSLIVIFGFLLLNDPDEDDVPTSPGT